MDVKEAVSAAKRYLADVFSGEPIADLGLEEIEFDPASETWNITLGFSRSWVSTDSFLLSKPRKPDAEGRTYKVVKIADADGKVVAVKNRDAH